MLCYQKKEPQKWQESGTVPPIGPHAHQLCFFGINKGANQCQIWENIERNKS